MIERGRDMVALIFCGDLKYCPYIKRYIEILDMNKNSYKIYFWNRSGDYIDLDSTYEYYNQSSKLNKAKIGKLIDFVEYRRWLIKKLNKDRPDKFIILSTLTGIILSDYIMKNRNQYIFDIRDYSYEYLGVYRDIESRIIENSFLTVISSKGFKSFLPKKNYIIAHNFNRNDIKGVYKFKKTDERITFVWNGLIRYFDYQKQYLDVLKNDERFLIKYHGDGPELDMYKQYAKMQKMKNIFFTGIYKNDEKEEMLKGADILNNCYGYRKNAGNKLKFAVSNRFYDGIIYHIPQLVEGEGFKTQWAKKSGIGISIQPNCDFADNLYNYYMHLDETKFDDNCDKILHMVLEEDDLFISSIEKFVS